MPVLRLHRRPCQFQRELQQELNPFQTSVKNTIELPTIAPGMLKYWPLTGIGTGRA
jgi:hypothetical protein